MLPIALPKFPVPRLSAALPTLPVSSVFAAAFNLTAWRGLKALDWDELHGKRFCVHVRDLGLKSYFSVGRDGLVPQFADHADVTFTATSKDFIRLALRLEDPDTLFFSRRLLIEGDTDAGLRVKNMLDAVELETLIQAMPIGMGPLLRYMQARVGQSG